MSASSVKDWLFCTAISCGLYLIGLLHPALVIPASLIYSLPSAFLAFERGPASALSSAFASSMAVGAAISVVAGGDAVVLHGGLPLFLMFGLSGIVTGRLARSGFRGGDLLVASWGAEFLGMLAGIVAIHALFGENLLAPDPSNLKHILAPRGGAALSPDVAGAIDRVILLMPYAFIFFSALEALACLTGLSAIHRRRTGETIYAPPRFKDWRFPRSVLLALMTGLICEWGASAGDSYLMLQVGANLVELSRAMFLLQGLSCVWFFIELKGPSRPLRIAAAIMTPVAASLFGYIFAILGVADMGLNLRENKIKGGSR